MGAIAAAFDKKGTDAISAVFAMLEELRHRGTMSPKVTSHPSIFLAQSLGTLRGEEAHSKAAVGSNSSEPILGSDFTWVFEGQFFPPAAASVHHIIDKTGLQPTEIARHILTELDGSYTFAVAFPDRVLAGRDTLGTKPLYYGENQSICAIATERKALWKIGITNAKSFPPGNLVIADESGFMFESVAPLKPSTKSRVNITDAAGQLEKLLKESTYERVSDVKRVGVAFSGGLDSGTIAFLVKHSGVSVHLICVGLEGQLEIERAREASETLRLPLTVQTYSVADVENTLPKVLWLIEEPGIMKVSVALPFFWTAEVASKLDCPVLLAGQGADELFGGYQRYLAEYAKNDAEKVEETLFNDTAISYETNFQRDEPVCAFHKVELRLPFVDTKVVRVALSLPFNLKIESAQDSLRKRVLRQAAKNLGIPSSIADKPKKAIQFATGVDKALEKLAKKEGLTKRSYINKIFREVYPNLEVKNR